MLFASYNIYNVVMSVKDMIQVPALMVLIIPQICWGIFYACIVFFYALKGDPNNMFTRFAKTIAVFFNILYGVMVVGIPVIIGGSFFPLTAPFIAPIGYVVNGLTLVI
jgi:hypothetical protein